MSSGKFRIQYKQVDLSIPCEGLQYRVVNKDTGASAAQGLTNAMGETQAFTATGDSATYAIELKDFHTNTFAPPQVSGADSASLTLVLDGRDDTSLITQAVCITPYFRVRFLTQKGNQPIAGAKFTAYQLDSNGKGVVARDLENNSPIVGKTDSRGDTGVVHCAASLTFKFEIPGTTVKVNTDKLQPLLQGGKITRYDMPLKTLPAHTVPQGQDFVAKVAGLVSLPVLISPEDSELIAVPQSAFDEFEKVSGMLEQVLANGHRAKLQLSQALEAGHAPDIAAAEKALGLAEDNIKKELNKNFSKLTDLKEVITVETSAKGGGNGKQVGLRRRYLSTDRYTQLKNERLNKSEFKLDIKFSEGPVKGSVGVSPKSLDTKALKDSFAKISKTLKSSHKLFESDPKVLALFDEASTQFSETVVKSASYEVEKHAQWLRMVSGAGASSEFDWNKKAAQIQGNLQGKLVLCEGKGIARYAVPSLKGWLMRFGDEDLGAVRAVVTCELYGFAGAKLVTSGAMGVSLDGLKQVVTGIKKDGKASLAKMIDPKTKLPVFDPVSPYEAMPNDLNGIKVETEAFAGVEGGITPGGQLQWLPPTEKEFVSFAEVSVSVAATAGAGFNGKVYVFLAEGKFRVRVAAGLCFGVGAKGALEFTVNAEKVFQFVKWVHYQLLNSGVRKLVFIEQRAFMLMSQLLLLLIQEGVAVLDGKTAEQARQTEVYRRIENICTEIDDRFDGWLATIDQAKVRNQLVQNINRKPSWLVYATPETRGMLIYQITRHGTPSHMRDTPSLAMVGIDPQIHFLPAHKTAVNNIMATVQTAKEWVDVMQHMSERGLKSKQTAGSNEGDAIRFLNNGYSLAENLPVLMQAVNLQVEVKGTGNEHLDAYLKMRNKVRHEFPKGYMVARLDTPHLDLALPDDGREHPSFAVIETAGLGEAYAGDPAANLT